MTTENYTGADRRHIEGAVDHLEKTFSEQSQIVARLIVVSENTANSVARLENWITSHELDYRSVRERVLAQEIASDTTIKRVEALALALETTMRTYLADRNKAVGGWVALTAVGAFIVGLLAVFKSFGVL